jgi:hypothetical protein
MRISEADIAAIHALLKDYQWYMGNYDKFVASAYGFPMFTTAKDVRPYREVRERIANTAPLLIKVLSMELPAGFTLLKTTDEQCYVWNTHGTLGLHGPVTEFQARLWCWQNEYVNEEVEITLVDDMDEVAIEAEEDEELLQGFKESLGGIDDSSAVLDESIIERMFSSYRGYRE